MYTLSASPLSGIVPDCHDPESGDRVDQNEEDKVSIGARVDGWPQRVTSAVETRVDGWWVKNWTVRAIRDLRPKSNERTNESCKDSESKTGEHDRLPGWGRLLRLWWRLTTDTSGVTWNPDTETFQGNNILGYSLTQGCLPWYHIHQVRFGTQSCLT